MEMFISFFTGKVMLFYGISLIMKEKSNASALSKMGAKDIVMKNRKRISEALIICSTIS